MDKNLKIAIAPNEDGFGTSAWVSMLAKELSHFADVEHVQILVSREKWDEFHQDKYAANPKIKPVILESNPNKIKVAKIQGSVNISQTIVEAIKTYGASRDTYAADLKSALNFDNIDMVIDFGVPQLVRAIYYENRQRENFSKKPIKVITVFDHAWSLTLHKIASSDPAHPELSTETVNQLKYMCEDESLTDKIILFGEPICPDEYHTYWKKILGYVDGIIPGSLGGPLRTIEYATGYGGDEHSKYLDDTGKCLPAAYQLARQQARQLLGIQNDDPILFISGGGTSVWNNILTQLINSYLNNPPNYNVVIYNPAEIKRRGITLSSAEPLEKATFDQAQRITFIGSLKGETHHVLFPAFDLILTRAGGGTVNNAIAFRVPLVLVEEQGMWQVEQIRQSCGRMNLATLVSLEDFSNNARSYVEENNQLKDLKELKGNMEKFQNHSEIWLCRELLAAL